MNSIDALLGLYRTTILGAISIIRNNPGFNLAIMTNFAIVFGVEIIHLQFYPYGNLPALSIWLGSASCALHLIECGIRGKAINRHEFVKGFSLYFLVLFVWFTVVATSIVILWFVAAYSGYEALWIPAHIIFYGSLLLPIAELLYQSRIRGLLICSAAFRFIRINWIEWLIPHALLIGLYILVIDILAGKEYPSQFMSYLIWFLFYGPFLNCILIIRGVLFAELSASTRQSRMALSRPTDAERLKA
jgi:hypothetical protein